MKKLIPMLILALLFPALCFGGVGLYGNPIPVVIHKGTNAPVLVKLYDIDNTALTAAEVAAITKIEVYYRSDSGATPETVDSVSYAAGFDKTTYAASGEILLKLGLVDFTAGRDRQAEIIIYNATYTSGRVIGLLDMQVSEDVEEGAELSDIVGTMTFQFTTESNITTPFTASVILLDGDDDGENDIIDLQDGSTDGQKIVLIAYADIDANDTITIAYTYTTCTNCPTLSFDKIGESATLYWTGSSWVVAGLIDDL